MDQFLETFGELTVYKVAIFIAGVFFLWKVYQKVKDYLIAQYEKEQKRDRQLKECLDQIALYPKWHDQSLEIQRRFTDAIDSLKKSQEENSRKLDDMEAKSQQRERNKLREQILQAYRYYTSLEKNPMQAWSEMEADAFWHTFGDYEDAGGNGHVHTIVQPDMRALETIPMHEAEKITALMQSRR